MGSMPYRMYDVYKKNAWSVLELVDKISPAVELRNSGVPAVVQSTSREEPTHPLGPKGIRLVPDYY
jgi:hypothetical protein